MARALSWIVLAACACGGDAGVALSNAPEAFAAAYCERAFACCDAAGRMALQFGAEITDEASCRAHVARVFGNEFVDDTRRAGAEGRASYDPDAMQACVDHLRADTCVHLAATLRRMTFPPECAPVRVALVANGEPCDHDFQCVSGACAVVGGDHAIGACAEVPAIGAACPTGDCGPTAYCDRRGESDVCAPIRADGEPCTSSLGCESLTCVDGVCTAPAFCTGG